VTRSTAEETRQRGRRVGRPVYEPLTFGGEAIRIMREAAEAAHRIRFPSPRYQADPIGFFDDILGVHPWSRAREILCAVRDHPRVAVKSGHKIAKSHTAAGIALWFYCSFPDARAIMSSTTARQVDEILWRELSMMRARSGVCLACKRGDPDGTLKAPCPHSGVIEGDIGLLARTGLKSPDFREIVGFTAREAEAVAGISGRNLLYLIDEASGVPDVIFEAMEGNRAGGARIVLFGNPTRTSGVFFDAFHSKSRFWHGITVSSEESPNVTGAEPPVPGLATPEWIAEKREEWGETSPMYAVRVKGEFPTREDGKIFSIDTITQAGARWSSTLAEGRLWIGIDPAGPTGEGDDTVFCARRGLKVLELVEFLGLNEAAHLVHLLGFIDAHKAHPREQPVVVLDREGPIGTKLYNLLGAHVAAHGGFELVGVAASGPASRDPAVYHRQRDVLTASLEAWVRSGGALPPHAKLEKQLHAVEWYTTAAGKVKVTAKEDLRRDLGRSPDHYDALALSTYEPLSLRLDDDVDASPAVRRLARDEEDTIGSAIDPYAAEDAWEERRRG
jgi:hypothetical protein